MSKDMSENKFSIYTAAGFHRQPSSTMHVDQSLDQACARLSDLQQKVDTAAERIKSQGTTGTLSLFSAVGGSQGEKVPYLTVVHESLNSTHEAIKGLESSPAESTRSTFGK